MLPIEEVEYEDFEGVLEEQQEDEEGATHHNEEQFGVPVGYHDLFQCISQLLLPLLARLRCQLLHRFNTL